LWTIPSFRTESRHHQDLWNLGHSVVLEVPAAAVQALAESREADERV